MSAKFQPDARSRYTASVTLITAESTVRLCEIGVSTALSTDHYDPDAAEVVAGVIEEIMRKREGGSLGVPCIPVACREGAYTIESVANVLLSMDEIHALREVCLENFEGLALYPKEYVCPISTRHFYGEFELDVRTLHRVSLHLPLEQGELRTEAAGDSQHLLYANSRWLTDFFKSVAAEMPRSVLAAKLTGNPKATLMESTHDRREGTTSVAVSYDFSRQRRRDSNRQLRAGVKALHLGLLSELAR